MKIVNVVLNNVLDDGRVLKTARSAVRHGFECAVLGFSKTKETEIHDLDGIRIILAPNVRWQMEAKGLWQRDVEERDMHLFVRESADLFCRHIPFDGDLILHTHDMFGLGTGAKMMRLLSRGGRRVGWVHDLHEYTRGATNISRNLQRHAIEQHERYIKEPDALLTVSDAIADNAVREDRLSRRPDVVYNAPSRSASMAPAPGRDIRSVLGLEDGVPLVIYSGSIASPERGVATLIEAMPDMPGVHVAIVTNRPKQFDELLAKATPLGAADRLHSHDYVPNEEIIGFLSTATIGCHPMHRYGNGDVAMPNKLFEYLHARLPVLASNVESMADFVARTGTGMIFEAQNARDLAARCRDLLAAREEVRARITPELLDFYSWEHHEPKIIDSYKRILEWLDPSNRAHRSARVVHGFTGAAGQPWAVTRGLRELGFAADAVRVFPEKTAVNFHNDHAYALDDPDDLGTALLRLAPRYDVFHFHAASLLRNSTKTMPTALDLLLLRAAGKRVLFHFRGSEARLPTLFREASPWHWLPPEADEAEAKHEAMQRRFLKIVTALSHAVFVTDPELLSYVPGSRIVPRAIDLQEWPATPLPDNPIPVVVHAPTNRDIKGTDHVIRAVEELRSEGMAIELRLVEGLDRAEAKKVYAAADVVIDQLRIGWYGVFAVEAMALGRPVMCYIRDDLAHHLGPTEPLLRTTIPALKDDLRRLILDRDLRLRLSRAGRDHVERVHDSAVVADQLRQLYNEALEFPVALDLPAALEFIEYRLPENRGQSRDSQRRRRRRRQNLLATVLVLAALGAVAVFAT